MNNLKGCLIYGVLPFLCIMGFFVLLDYMGTTPEQREERQYDRPLISESEAIEIAMHHAYSYNDVSHFIYETSAGWTAQYIGNRRWIVNYGDLQWEVREISDIPSEGWAIFLGQK